MGRSRGPYGAAVPIWPWSAPRPNWATPCAPSPPTTGSAARDSVPKGGSAPSGNGWPCLTAPCPSSIPGGVATTPSWPGLRRRRRRAGGGGGDGLQAGPTASVVLVDRDVALAREAKSFPAGRPRGLKVIAFATGAGWERTAAVLARRAWSNLVGVNRDDSLGRRRLLPARRMAGPCLASVAGQADQVVLIDNGSEGAVASQIGREAGADGSPLPGQHRVRSRRQPRRRDGQGGLLALLNDDAVAGPGWLRSARAGSRGPVDRRRSAEDRPVGPLPGGGLGRPGVGGPGGQPSARAPGALGQGRRDRDAGGRLRARPAPARARR